MRRDSDRLVVCEVKTRSRTRYGLPAEAVDARKAAPHPAAAQALAGRRTTSPGCEVRFDVLAVLVEPGPARVHHYEAAF